jgi:hypothetical protein
MTTKYLPGFMASTYHQSHKYPTVHPLPKLRYLSHSQLELGRTKSKSFEAGLHKATAQRNNTIDLLTYKSISYDGFNHYGNSDRLLEIIGYV